MKPDKRLDTRRHLIKRLKMLEDELIRDGKIKRRSVSVRQGRPSVDTNKERVYNDIE